MQPERDHAQRVLLSLDSMRRERIVCDVVVHVAEKTFHVHRAVLVANSGYFRGLFVSGLKEAVEGVIHMKDADSTAFEECVDFMYTGKARVTLDYAEKVLYLSDLMQLDVLFQHCSSVLRANLGISNCLHLKNIAHTFSCVDLEESAIAFVANNLEDIITQDEFVSIPESDLFLCLRASPAHYAIKWKAIQTWGNTDEGKKQKVAEAIRILLNNSTLPTHFVYQVFKDPFIEGLSNLKGLILSRIFQDREYLAESMDITEWFYLKGIAQQLVVDSMVIIEVMGKHLKLTSDQKNFLAMDMHEVGKLLETSDSELVKWSSLMKWISHDPDRSESFVQLFRLISVKKLPAHFIKSVILEETLVKDSHACKDLIINHLLSVCKTSPTIMLLDQSRGELVSFDIARELWIPMCAIRRYEFTRIVAVGSSIYCILDRTLLMFSVENGWSQKAELKHQPESETQAVCLSGCICLVGNVYLSICMLEKDEWNFIEFPRENRTQNILGEGFCAAILADQIFAVGGGHLLDGGVSFSPSRLEFRSLPKMTATRYGAAAAATCDKIFVAGGWDGKKILQSVEYFTINHQSWTRLQDMISPRYAFSLCCLQDRVFATGGSHQHDGSRSEKDTIEVLLGKNSRTVYEMNVESVQAVIVSI